ncbi:HAD family hydrolase [soil metagenome]
MTSSRLVVGFDLDMTLIDSRPGIKAVYEALSAETGVLIDTDLVVSRLGPPVEMELRNWFPESEVDTRADRYRALYPDIAIAKIQALPGAVAALEAVRAVGRAIVITAKAGNNAQLHLDHLDLTADTVFGSAWRGGKADVLRAETATIYVGDHVHDMAAAASAGIIGVGVATGPCSREELLGSGAHEVLTSLAEFPAWLETHTQST